MVGPSLTFATATEKMLNTHKMCDFPTANANNVGKQIAKIAHQPFDLQSYLFTLERTGICFLGKPQDLLHRTCNTLKKMHYTYPQRQRL